MPFQKLFVIADAGAQVIMWLLLLLSVLSLAAIIERWLVLRQVKAKGQRIKDQLAHAIAAQNLEELSDLAKDRDSIEGRALGYGLKHVKDHGPDGVGELINSYALMEKPKLERSLNFLATVGNNAPFVGLLGTVFGIMKAFHDLGVSQGDAASVMTGIADALAATAVGLFVAIPAVAAYNHFQKQVKHTLAGLDAIRDLCIAYAKRKGK
ncbi:MAG TPA: MotA/TolQ/ExbB proton channel family protein [Bdellovibrionales bacterium]|nr:MotA/TolQ/ExbB proton channel family protein [Bdellovibrionales bacterium]